MCLSLTLGFTYGRLFGTLALAEKQLLAMSKEKRWRLHCATFGMIDALAQRKGMSQEVTSTVAAAFFQWRLFNTEAQGPYILMKTMQVRPGMDGGDFIVQGGQAILDFLRNEDINSFERLGTMLL